jgi:hypothetical protein
VLGVTLALFAGCATGNLGPSWASETPAAEVVDDPEASAAQHIALHPECRASGVSGLSMAPCILNGDLILYVPEEFAHLRAGQTVVRYCPALGIYVAHTLIDYNPATHSWTTGGVGNREFDLDPLTRENLVGRVMRVLRLNPAIAAQQKLKQGVRLAQIDHESN